VHAGEEVVDAEIGEKQHEEGQEHVGVVGGGEAFLAHEPRGEPLQVEGHGIDHEGDERPRLLGVPRPVLAPAHVGPNGADEDADGEGGNGRIEQQLGELQEGFFGGRIGIFPSESAERERRK